MSRPRICIAHQTIWIGDAIGNDIAGECELLQRCGYDVALLCEIAHPDLCARFRVIGSDICAASAGFDLMLFHHSIHWPVGEQLIEGFAGPIVVKYHNITPPEFFEHYSSRYRDVCAEGRAQTVRMASMPAISRWQCDSAYNSLEIGGLGVPDDRLSVVPPFNQIDAVFGHPREAHYSPAGPFQALFVGRRVPNKGHGHILRTLAAWRDLFPESELRCRIIGAVDVQVAPYFRELEQLEQALGIGDRVEWLGHVTVAELKRLFSTSHLYLNLSEHEGFCVPVIESQAFGLPVLSTNATAIRETAGAEQITMPVPRLLQDYDVLAGLAHEVCTSSQLRRALVEAGCRNAYERFTADVLETRFIGDLEPLLRSVEA